MRWPAQRGVGAACGLAALLAAGPASAANGNIPRTPPIFPPHACLTMVDRSVDSSFEFKVGIPFEDTMLTEDELDDSRTFEFFAMCRDDPPATVFPNWIDLEDAERALAVGNIDELPASDDVLATAQRWAVGHDGSEGSCVHATGPRTAISCDATQDGLAWDTTGVPAGNYAIHGYTFAPAMNQWTPRTGVVQVNDGTPLPVAAFASPVYDATVYVESGYRVQGCMGGPDGTRVTLAWASIADELDGDVAGVWTDFAELDAADAAFEVLLLPPESAIYKGLVMRATAEDDAGHSWVAYSRGYLTIYPGSEPSDEPEIPPGPDHCDVGEEPTAGLELDGGDDTTSTDSGTGPTSQSGAAPESKPDGEGCGCDAGRTRGAHALPLVVVLALRRRNVPK